jgi:hypothetical protein
MPRLLRRAAPWLVVYEMGRAAKDHWDHLDPRDRNRLAELVRRSKGRPQNLSRSERDELRQLVRRLELLRLGGAIGGAAIAGRRGRRGRRGH